LRAAGLFFPQIISLPARVEPAPKKFSGGRNWEVLLRKIVETGCPVPIIGDIGVRRLAATVSTQRFAVAAESRIPNTIVPKLELGNDEI
jgi:hypothetical protein